MGASRVEALEALPGGVWRCLAERKERRAWPFLAPPIGWEPHSVVRRVWVGAGRDHAGTGTSQSVSESVGNGATRHSTWSGKLPSLQFEYPYSHDELAPRTGPGAALRDRLHRQRLQRAHRHITSTSSRRFVRYSVRYWRACSEHALDGTIAPGSCLAC